MQKVTNHFHIKADKGKRYFQIYKYTSIILAAITTIISSFQVIYASTFPHWILPIVSAGATVAVAFLGAVSAQKIWINSNQHNKNYELNNFYLTNMPANILISQKKKACGFFQKQ